MAKTPIVLKSEKGLTLVESMVAMVIFSAVILMATPPIILSMASRIRSYQAQQAMQIAQGQVDKVKVIVAQAEKDANDQIPWTDILPVSSNAARPQDVPAPTVAIPNELCDQGFPNAVTSMCFVDVKKAPNQTIPVFEEGDFAVQIFRTNDFPNNPVEAATDGIIAFKLGVRVYTFGSLTNFPVLLQDKTASLSFSNTTSSSRPLAMVYDEVIKIGLDKQPYEQYCQFLANQAQGSVTCPSPTPSP